MPSRMYFDLATVTELTIHAILADRTVPTGEDLANHTDPQPALWFYRSPGGIYLASNGVTTSHDIAMGRPYTVRANPADALTTPCVRPPHRRRPTVLPLLRPKGQSLIDLLYRGVAGGANVVALDPLTNTVGVGRRRRRVARALAGHTR